MPCEYQITAGIIRVYREGETYGRHPHVAAINIMHTHDGAILTAATATKAHALGRRALREVVSLLMSMGIKKLYMERLVGHRVPLGKYIESGHMQGYYMVDLADAVTEKA